jgi:putative transcriptional regulator
MSKLGQELIEGMTEAVAHAKGEPTAAKVHVIEVPDVRALREQLHMSQSEFSEAYKIPLATLQGWEQRRRAPDATATAYLNVIARLPEQAREALNV